MKTISKKACLLVELFREIQSYSGVEDYWRLITTQSSLINIKKDTMIYTLDTTNPEYRDWEQFVTQNLIVDRSKQLKLKTALFIEDFPTGLNLHDCSGLWIVIGRYIIPQFPELPEIIENVRNEVTLQDDSAHHNGVIDFNDWGNCFAHLTSVKIYGFKELKEVSCLSHLKELFLFDCEALVGNVSYLGEEERCAGIHKSPIIL